MNLLSLISKLKKLDIHIEVEDQNLKLNAPEGALTADIITSIKEQKKAIIDFFKKRSQKNQTFTSINPAEKKDYYILSSSQKRLYILHQTDNTGIAYNTPLILKIEGHLEKEKLKKIFQYLIHQHESLRTSFHMLGEEPIQRVFDYKEINIDDIGRIEYLEKRSEKETEREKGDSNEITRCIKRFICPFNLSKAPLLRLRFLYISEKNYLLMLDMHHIITDGFSMGVLIKNFVSLYRDNKLSNSRLQYTDFSEWQNHPRQKKAMIKQSQFWENQFQDEIPVLNLPTDQPRPLVQNFKGDTIQLEIHQEHIQELKIVAQNEGISIFILLLSIFNIFLSKISDQEDIIVGIPIAGRKHTGLQDIIGMFVNTLAFRSFPKGEKPFSQFLKEVKTQTVMAFENQDYPLEDLVDKLSIERDTSRNPLFNVALNSLNIELPLIEFKDFKIKPYNYKTHIAKFDLLLTVVERDEKLSFIFEYGTELFSEDTIHRFIRYWERIIINISKNPSTTISQLDVLTFAEKQQILDRFNNSNIEYPREKTIHQIFNEQVECSPDHIALIGVSSSMNHPENIAISYRKVGSQSGQIATRLRKEGVKPDSIVGIMAERSIELIFSILGILKAGGAYLPIDPEYPQERQQYMLKNSGALFLINVSNDSTLHFSNGNPLPYTSLNSRKPSHLIRPSHSLAYVIYTSGTTGGPKGVLIEHRNVVRLMFNDNYLFKFNCRDVWTVFHSFSFDFSVWEMYGALLNGGKLILISKKTARNTPQFLEILKKEKTTVLNQTPSAFYVLSQLELQQAAKDLHLRYIIFGGEALKPLKLKNWKEKYPGTQLINMYGITETTVHVTFKEIDHRDISSNISNIGFPIPTLSTYVMDRNLNLVPIGVAGELCVGGEGMGRGYLNSPIKTSEKFVENPFFTGTNIYRSGDLVKLINIQELEYLGRIDQQVKIRGFRIEPGEIEKLLIQSGLVQDAIVIKDKDKSEDSRLLCYLIPAKKYRHVITQFKRSANIDTRDTRNLYGSEKYFPEVRKYLKNNLPDFMMPTYFMAIEKIPLTLNGKLNRKALPSPEFLPNHQVVLPRDEVEKRLAEIWSDLLGINQEKISIDSHFFQLGGHSLKATVLAARIYKEMNINLSLTKIFKFPRLKDLAAKIKASVQKRFILIAPVEKKEYYSLSSSQKRLYILHKMERHLINYNVPGLWKLEGVIDPVRLENTFNKIIRRHEILRTSFQMINNEPVQQIHAPGKIGFKVQYIDVVKNRTKEKKENLDKIFRQFKGFIRPFDLSQVPLLRVGLMILHGNHFFLMVDLHHIITDGVSQNILMKEFLSLYQDITPIHPRIQYKDYSEWINQENQREKIKHQELFWINQFLEEPPRLNLPADFPRPLEQNFKGRAIHFHLEEKQVHSLQKFAENLGITEFMLILSIYQIFLSKLTAHEDIVVGVPIAGRQHTGLNDMIGMFVNTLAIRIYPVGTKSVKQFIEEVKGLTLKAFENQEYPFEDLVEILPITRDTSRNPIFDVLFNFQNMEPPQLEIQGLKLKPISYEMGISKFDLNFTAIREKKLLSFIFEYPTSLFKEGTIERFILHFKKVVIDILSHPNIHLSEIEIITADEKKWVLEKCNAIIDGYPQNNSLHHLFEKQENLYPDRIAVEWGTKQLTYKGLNQKANQLAHQLIKKGIKSNTIIGIMLDRSLEMLIGIFGVLKAGAGFLPLTPNSPENRITYILKDSGIQWVVTGNELKHNFGKNCKGIDLYNKKIFSDSTHNIYNLKNRINGRGIAYIIYTSGSTGRPKGTIIEHHSVTHLLITLFKKYPFGRKDIYLLKTSFVFDVSVTELFGWCLGAGKLSILKQDHEKEPGLILNAIENQHVTHINFVPSMFNYFVDYLYHQNKRSLAQLKYIFLAGEEVNSQSIKKFKKLFGNRIELENLYGPTEATIYASQYSLRNWDGISRIPIGTPLTNVRLYIVNFDSHLQPIGIPGELWISGIGLSRGYLNKTDLTAENFCFKQWGDGSSNSQKTYKTGDLARWLEDGNIEFLGRKDYQVKIRGFRIELGEIENQLQKYEPVKDVITTVRAENNTEKYICAYIILKSPDNDKFNPINFREYLSGKLPEYMIPSHFVIINEIPLTPSGKVNRKELPKPEIQKGKEFIPPKNEVQVKLARIWSDILKIDKNKIDMNDHFFHLGGHSLKATVLTSQIHKEFNVSVPLNVIFKAPRMSELASYIMESKSERFASIRPTEKKEFYPLSPAQKRMYVLHQMDEYGIGYNIPAIWELEGIIDIKRIENTFAKLILRHESLRTSFYLNKEEPLQKVHNSIVFKIEYNEVEGYDEKKREKIDLPIHKLLKNFLRYFNLSEAPLLRVRLIRVQKDRHLLLVDMHHIITDGISMGILIKEFALIFQDTHLASAKIQYKDFSTWQNSQLIKETIEKQENYWLREFQEEIPALDLPIDFKRPSMRSFEGSRIHFVIDSETFRAVNQLALDNQMTLYMLFLSIYTIYLSKLSNQEDIIVGSPVAGRKHADLESIIGMFVNTLALRNYPNGSKELKSYLQEVKEKTLMAFNHQEFPYEELIEKLILPRDASRNPLFDTMLTLQNMDNKEIQIPDLRITPHLFNPNTAKFDISLTVAEVDESLTCQFEYCSQLFKQETLQQMVKYFKTVLKNILANPACKISEITLISEEEKQQILFEYNTTQFSQSGWHSQPKKSLERKKSDPKRKILGIKTSNYKIEVQKTHLTIHELFEEQVKLIPHQTALVWEDTHLSYLQLNECANELSGELINKGLGLSDRVIMLLERSPMLVVAMLGILKTGGIYIPLSPQIPGARLDVITRDSIARMVLYQGMKLKRELEKIPSGVEEMIDLDELKFNSRGSDQKTEKPPKIGIKSTDSAYLLFTSGSTGIPKGVLVEHNNVVNVIKWYGRQFNLKPNLRVLQTAEYTFDASVEQIFSTLSHGATLFMLKRSVLLDLNDLRNFILEKDINVIDFVPSVLKELLGSRKRLKSLKAIISGAEALTEDTKKDILGKGYHLYNLYGPTEATVDALVWKCNDEPVSLGQPIDNVNCFILDKYENLLPIGIPGELVLSGTGIARGYLNNPELTTNRFCFLQISGDWQSQPITPCQGRTTQDNLNNKFDSNKNKSCQQNEIPLSGAYFKKIPTYRRSYNSRRLYKTGDLGRWLSTGNIEFLGRIDFQVKIRGFRIELEEIENQIRKHEGIKDTAVIARQDDPKDKYLCAYIVNNKSDFKPSELKDFLSESLPDYMLPSYFVKLEKIPLTANGKINHQALPEPAFNNLGKYHPPRNNIERKLEKIWKEILFKDTSNISQEIGIDSNFFELGGHSLKATILVSRIQMEMGKKIGLAELFKNQTIRKLAKILKQSISSQSISTINPVEKKEYYSLSSAQKRFYILQQMDLNNTAYNMFLILSLNSYIKKENLENVFYQLILRHEILRTSFLNLNGEPIQKIQEDFHFQLEYKEIVIATIDIESRKREIIKNFLRPFNLSSSPLIRVGYINISKETKLLLIDIHHIISDEVSLMEILMKDFVTLYSGENLPPLKIQYKDFVNWQHQKEQQDRIKQQESYWLNLYSKPFPVLHLPLDFPRPPIKSFAGSQISYILSKNKSDELRRISKENNATLFMTLFSLFCIFISKLADTEQFILGIPVAGRRYTGLDNITGVFINSLALTCNVPGSENFLQLLKEVKKHVLEAFENQEYPFDDLVDKIMEKRIPNRNPLFDVMFAFNRLEKNENAHMKMGIIQNKNNQSSFEKETSQFELGMNADEGEKIQFRLEYGKKVFKKESIKKYLAYFQSLIDIIIDNPKTKISEIDVIPEDQKKVISQLIQLETKRYSTAGQEPVMLPRTPLEKKLAEIWEKMLKKENISINDNIFQLGANSIKVLMTVSEINKEFNKNLLITDIYESPTIGKMAEIIAPQTTEKPEITDPNLVLLKKNMDHNKHLFFIHDITGKVDGYIDLVTQLNTNCWGLTADPLKNFSPAQWQIEDMAHKYIEKIKKVQKDGPYYILGWSLGGIIAFEITHQLEKRNERVAFLALIDSPPPTHSPTNTPKFTLDSELQFILKHIPTNEKMKEKLLHLTDIHQIWPAVMDFINTEKTDFNDIKKRIPVYIFRAFTGNDKGESQEIIEDLNKMRTLKNAGANYFPQYKIQSPTFFFAATGSKDETDHLWQNFCQNPINYIEVEGDHYSILKGSNVVNIIKSISKHLTNE